MSTIELLQKKQKNTLIPKQLEKSVFGLSEMVTDVVSDQDEKPILEVRDVYTKYWVV